MVDGKWISLQPFLKGRTHPLYLYSWPAMEERVKWYRDSFPRAKICYALKANPNPELLKRLARQGIGADVVSGGELERALTAGIKARDIVFSGVGKSFQELELAVASGIGQVNVESLPELQRLAGLCRQKKAKVRVALRLNPEVDVNTHKYIATGGRENKFGLDWVQIAEAVQILRTHANELQFHGLAMHVGSQLLELEPVFQAARRLVEIFLRLRQEGWPLQSLDFGGGLGINYQKNETDEDRSHLRNYAEGLKQILKTVDAELVLEPGRFLVARAGVLLTQVEYVKPTPHRLFVIVNSGMNHLLRPALYQARHRIMAVEESGREMVTCDVVGPICESSDVLGVGCQLPQPREGDWLALLDTGAYGYSMASTYNLRPLPEEVVIG